MDAQNIDVNEVVDNTEMPTDSPELEDVLKDRVKQIYDEGLHSGTWLTCQVVLSMLNDKSKPLTQRVGDIKHFCNTIKPLGQSKPEDKDATTNA